jgi:hypothetical protein
MSRIKTAAAVVLLASVSASTAAFAQQEEFLPDNYTIQQERGAYKGPVDAYGSAVAPSNRRELRSAPSGYSVIDPETGRNIGTDPDPQVRLELRRDPPSDRAE